MAITPPPDIRQLLGAHPHSKELTDHVSSLATLISKPSTAPEVKSYSDAIYFNYFALGLSLLFKPINGYKPKGGLKQEELRDADLVLDSIDIYNVIKSSKPGTAKPFAAYPMSPLVLTLSSQPLEKDAKPRPSHFEVKPETTGKDFVACLGEPDRKGGGAGPSSGSIGIWCEWSKDGVMVEFGGEESRGPQAWERGKDAVWKVLSVFPRGDST
ncbi:uncharacterized protein B0H18DRAFT_968947 [Fomitopsis serialis]|uniref:uncharacterized protein n=1 Tax=Fomitopsis serialis TaxID=139415 RepID=UPI00200823D0|nr:uncharacterized protein B0H18DRAFT_968947 [Neoantrodia serialis]KAH9937061.1 hypothetical protein B0H18DRAFT_968947 [Neoantrodia serialis]